jgi:putative PIN family toxin of toxin-antitoxin system
VKSATLDSNIYISAFEFGGIGARFISLAGAGQLRIDTSESILNETIGVLRDKFKWDGYRLRFARDALARLANVVSPKIQVNVALDPDDDRILECALEATSDVIVTRDRHLLSLKSFQGISIVTPEEFLARETVR